jgi:hypothetical protein
VFSVFISQEDLQAGNTADSHGVKHHDEILGADTGFTKIVQQSLASTLSCHMFDGTWLSYLIEDHCDLM